MRRNPWKVKTNGQVVLGVPLETEEQASLFKWRDAFMRTYPELSMLFAIPGQAVARLKRLQVEGYQRGIPDMFLAVPRNGFSGLFIELKRQKGGKVSLEQYDWLDKLNAQGYQAVISNGWEEARDVIVNYLEGRI